MAEHRYIKLPNIKTVFESKAQAIERTVRYIQEHIDTFHDGESLLIRFHDGDVGKVISANVFVNISEEGNVSLSFGLDSNETIRVVETENEPQDKDALWLTDEIDDKDVTITTLENEIKALRYTLRSMMYLIEKHEYALTHTLCGGDFITNSVKYQLTNENQREVPVDIDYRPYTTGDTTIVNFELFLANTNLTYYTTQGDLYKQQYYYIEPRYYNAEEERVSDSGVTLELSSSNEQVAIAHYYEHGGRWYIFANTSGVTKITATVVTPSGGTLEKEYTLNFKYNEETDYEQYYEPNVKHILVKTADTYDILTGNTDYLLLNEFVWCIGNNSLYFKALGSNGKIKLFKINGSGDTPVVVTGITYEIDSNGILDIEDNNIEKQVYVDEDGILHLVGYIDEDGYLCLDDTGSEETHTIDEDGNLVMNNVEIDDEGYLILRNATVDEDGNLIMN